MKAGRSRSASQAPSSMLWIASVSTSTESERVTKPPWVRALMPPRKAIEDMPNRPPDSMPARIILPSLSRRENSPGLTQATITPAVTIPVASQASTGKRAPSKATPSSGTHSNATMALKALRSGQHPRAARAARHEGRLMRPAVPGLGIRDDACSLYLEQSCQLLDHRAGQLLDIHDRHRAPVIARHVVADADCHQLHRRLAFDPVDHPAQMRFQIARAIDRQRRIVDRRAVGNHHQDAAVFLTCQQPGVRPEQRLAVDVFLEQPLAHHQAKI